MQKGFAHLLLIAIFVLATLAAAGTYFFIFKNQPSPPDKLIPPTPPNSEDLPWQTFKSDEAPFTFEYPQTWSLENIPLSGDYQGIVLKGSEGEINMDWGSGFGGACAGVMDQFQFKEEMSSACLTENSDGSEDWTLISKEISKTVGFSARAKVNSPANQNRKLILKIFDTLSFSSKSETESTNTYLNPTYKYKVDYPNNYAVSSNFDEYLEITSDKDRNVIDIEPQGDDLLSADSKKMSGYDYMVYRLLMMCAADGPEGSLYCDKVAKVTSFNNEFGQKIYEFYLNRVRKSYKGGNEKIVEQKTVGPVFGIELLSSGNQQIRLVFIYNQNESLFPTKDNWDLSVLRGIADSFRFEK